MKVRELVEWLAEYDPDSEVTMDFSDSGSGLLAWRYLLARDMGDPSDRELRSAVAEMGKAWAGLAVALLDELHGRVPVAGQVEDMS